MTHATTNAIAALFCFGTLLSGSLFTTQARAESAFGPTKGTVRRIDSPEPNAPPGDGVYGRFNGDVSLQFGAGVEAALQEPTFRPLVLGNVSLYQTLGVYGSYRESISDSDPWQRVISAGLAVSPLFLIRWPRSLETGAATWDLTLDSLALVCGVTFPQVDDSGIFATPRAEFGVEFGVPLLKRANGLFLRSRGQLTSGEQLAPSVWLWLSFQGFVNAGILQVDR